MMHFYIVMINVNSGLTIVDVQAALTNTVQWYRIANNVWIVHTNLGVVWLNDRLQSLANPSGRLFISRLDPRERQGWMDQAFWDWVVYRIQLGV